MRDRLDPGSCSGDGTVAGLPAGRCPEPAGIAYSYTIRGHWVELDNTFNFGLSAYADIDPTPADGSWSTQLEVGLTTSGPVSEPPLTSQAPTVWEPAGPPFTTVPAVTIPRAFWPFDPGVSAWLRFTITDSEGCVAVWLVYFPDGLPVDWTHPVEVWIQVNDLAWVGATIPGSTEVPTDVDAVTDEPGDCPDGQQGVMVMAACPDGLVVQATTPIPVAIVAGEASFPSGFHITGQVAADQGDPLAVTIVGPDPLPVVLPAPVPVLIDALVVRLTGVLAPQVFSGRRSIAVVVLAGAPTVNGVVVPVGVSLSWSVDDPDETLSDVTVTTAGGDDVIVTSTEVD